MTTNTQRWMADAAAVVLAVTMGVGGAIAGPARAGRAQEAARAYRAALAQVGLTPGQKAHIKALVTKERPTLESLRGRQQISAAALQALLQAPNPDPTAVGNALLKLRADRMAVRAEMKNLRRQTVAVLTPTQKARLNGYLDALRTVRQRSRGLSKPQFARCAGPRAVSGPGPRATRPAVRGRASQERQVLTPVKAARGRVA